MLDLEKYSERRVSNLEYETALERAKASIIFIEEQYNQFKSTCHHDLVIRFGKKTPYDQTDTGYAVCLCCGKEFDNKTLRESANINIINAENVMSEEYYRLGTMLAFQSMIEAAKKKTRDLVNRARNKMDELMLTDSDITLEVIEKEIVLDLISFCEETIRNEDKYSLELIRYKK